jgi:hypothetical protein
MDELSVEALFPGEHLDGPLAVGRLQSERVGCLVGCPTTRLAVEMPNVQQ